MSRSDEVRKFPASYSQLGTFGDLVAESGRSHWNLVSVHPSNVGSWTCSTLKIDQLLLNDFVTSIDKWNMETLRRLCCASSSTELHVRGIHHQECLEIQIPTLEILRVGGFKLNCTHARNIMKFLQDPFTRLQKLTCARCQIGDLEVELILAAGLGISHSTKLEFLDLSMNNIGDKGAKCLSLALQNHHTRLKMLYLDLNQIGDEGAKYLGEALQSQHIKLKELSVTSNRIGDEGARYIAEGLRYGALKELNLTGNHDIKEEGTMAITQSLRQQQSSVERLHMACDNIGEEGVKHVAQMLQDARCPVKWLTITISTKNDLTAIVESFKTCKLENLMLFSPDSDNYLNDEPANYLDDDHEPATKQLLSALDSCYWCPLRFLQISSSPSARTVRSMLDRNEAICEGDLIRFERIQPSTAKLFICGESTKAKESIINGIMGQKRFSGKKSSLSPMELGLTSFECKNIKKLLISSVKQSDGYFPFFSTRPRHSLFLIICSLPLNDGQQEINMQLHYWLKSIYSSSCYHSPKAKVMFCLDFPEEYLSNFPNKSGKNKLKAIASLRETASRRLQKIIKHYEQVIDFGVGSDNVFVNVQHEVADVKKINHRMQTLFMELQMEEYFVPKICDDLVHFLLGLWKKNQSPSSPLTTIDLLISQFQKQHDHLKASDLNIRSALQLLHSSGYVVYNSTTGIVLLTREFFMHLVRYWEAVGHGSMVTEDIAVRLKDEKQVQDKLVDKVIYCLRHEGVICPKSEEWEEWDGDLTKIPKEFFLPSAISELPKWHEPKAKDVFWGRRLECSNKDIMSIPQQLFRKLQAKQSLCNMGSTWWHFVKNGVEVIVRIGGKDEGWEDKQWIDVMFKVSEEQMHNLNQHSILAQIVHQIDEICYSFCPNVKLEEKAIGSGAVKSLDPFDVNTELLSVIMAELTQYGIKHMHQWDNGRSTELKELLSPLETNVHLLNIADAFTEEFELDKKNTIIEWSSTRRNMLQAADIGKIFRISVTLFQHFFGYARLESLINQRFDKTDMMIEGLAATMGKTEERIQELCSKMTSKMLNIINLVDSPFPRLPCLKKSNQFVMKLSPLFEKEVVLHFMCEWEKGAHEVVDAKGFKFKLTRAWVVKIAPVLAPALHILALATKMAAAGLSTNACPLPLFTGSTVIQKAIIPEVLKEFAAGLETEIAKDWSTKPDPSLLRALLEQIAPGKRIHLRWSFGLFRVQSSSGIQYLCDRHSRPFPHVANQDLLL